MNLDDNLNETIENAVNDSIAPPDPVDPAIDASDTVVGDDPATGIAPAPTDGTEPVKDDFAERFGVQGQSFTGKENRIPYSRVRKIVAKAESEAQKTIREQLEKEFNPKLTDYEAQVKDYQTKLDKVAQFEQILERDPQTFLGMLSKHPAYKPFFDQVNQLMSGQIPPPTQQPPAGMQRDPQTGRFVPQQQATDPMPQPDRQFPDGTVGYSEEGLAKLMDWNGRNVENRVVKQIEQRYAPIEQNWQAQQRIAEMQPQIERQIAEARTWDRFSDLEAEIVQLLQQNPTMNLERAYMQAYHKNVIPKLAADRNSIRAEVLAELKKAPVNTSVPARNVRSQPTPGAGPRPIEDIIREEMEKASR